MTSSLTVCIGAMAVVGAFEDGLHHNYAILFAKAILDFIIILIMASSMGKGSLFSFIPVGIFQGSLTLLAQYLAPLISNQGLSQLSFIGSILIFCVGVNLFFWTENKGCESTAEFDIGTTLAMVKEMCFRGLSKGHFFFCFERIRKIIKKFRKLTEKLKNI